MMAVADLLNGIETIRSVCPPVERRCRTLREDPCKPGRTDRDVLRRGADPHGIVPPPLPRRTPNPPRANLRNEGLDA